MKKLLSFFLALTLFCSAFLLLVSCGETPAKKGPSVMTLSLNPEVEFLLDENGVVVSANALNEEGNLVLNAAVFVGKTNEEAVKLFIDVTKETGFLVSGSVEADENNIKVAFSGEDAEKRYDAIKKNVTDYLDAKGITAGFENAAALTDEYLNGQLEKCLPYLDEAKLTAMSYEEKLAALKTSREETASLTSEQLKNAYYEAKKQLDTVYAQMISTIKGLGGNIETSLNEASDHITGELDNVTSAFETEYASSITAAKNQWSAMEDALKAGYKAPEN